MVPPSVNAPEEKRDPALGEADVPAVAALAPAKPKPSYARKHRAQAVAVLVALAVLAAVLARWWLGPQVITGTVLRRDFVQSVVASGHVEAPHRLDVGAQITGTVLRVPVAEGQAVKAGDLLVELDAAELTATGRQADAAVAQARARLRQLQEVQAPVAAQTLRQSQATLENARGFGAQPGAVRQGLRRAGGTR